jgi:hypothetical protein
MCWYCDVLMELNTTYQTSPDFSHTTTEQQTSRFSFPGDHEPIVLFFGEVTNAVLPDLIYLFQDLSLCHPLQLHHA